MLNDLESYDFDNKYKIVKDFVTSCYSCFLSYTGNKKQKIGVYPIPTGPMIECTADLAENLNVSSSFGKVSLFRFLLNFFH